MTASSMLPVLLPIALFVLTLIIIFTLRAGDKRSKSLANVKKLLDIYKGNIEASDNSFKQYASELEQTVAKKDAEVRSLIQTVIAQTNELKSYSEDLLRLKSAMATYQTALDGLAVLTREADDKVQTVQNEVDRLDKIRDVIDGFRQDMKDADEHLRKHEQRVVQLEREAIGRMNDAVSETDSSMDEAMAGLHKESDEVFEDFRTGERAFFGDVADDDDGRVGGFGGADNEVATVGDLRDAAWGGGDFGEGKGLD